MKKSLNLGKNQQKETCVTEKLTSDKGLLDVIWAEEGVCLYVLEGSGNSCTGIMKGAPTALLSTLWMLQGAYSMHSTIKSEKRNIYIRGVVSVR